MLKKDRGLARRELQVSTFEEEVQRLQTLTGVSVPPVICGPSAFFRALPGWLRADQDDDKRHVIVFADPALNLSLPYVEDELQLALTAKLRIKPSRNEIEELASRYNIPLELLDRPTTSLSGGERMLVSLAKGAALAGAADVLTVCSPYFWLDESNRSVVNRAVDEFTASGGETNVLLLAGESDQTTQYAMRNAELTLPWSLAFDRILVTFPAQSFPRETTEKSVAINLPSSKLALRSPTLLRGSNGTGKTTFAKLLCGLLVSQADEPRVVTRGYTGEARLLLQDSILHLFGFTADDHLARVFRFDTERRKTALQLFDELQKECAAFLSDRDSTLHLGPRDRPFSMLQAKLALVAERLVSETPLLILDEPGWCLSVELARAFLRCVASTAHNRGTAVLVISHQPNWWRDIVNDTIMLSPSGPEMKLLREDM